MQFPAPLQEATLIQRYKRFLADVRLGNGEVRTLHCPNTGSMRNCSDPDSTVWFTDSGNNQRKYPCTLQLVTNAAGQLVGVNTALANPLVVEAIRDGHLAELQGYAALATEVKYGDQNSRIDILLSAPTENRLAARCYVEVKNVSLATGGARALFPDAVTARGHKHLQELMLMRAQGHRAVLCFCVQISGVESVAPADEIDPEYARLLREAAANGVEVLAYGASVNLAQSRLRLDRRLRVDL